jgi:DNA gyrase subunit A
MVRTRAAEIAQVGRNTQGVTLMKVAPGERLIALEAIEVVEGEGGEPGEGAEAAATPDSAA